MMIAIRCARLMSYFVLTMSDRVKKKETAGERFYRLTILPGL